MEERAIAEDAVDEALEPRIPTMDEIVSQMGEHRLLPKPYISMSTAPNRRTRRLAHQRVVKLQRRVARWRADLLAYGINPEDVLLERKEKAKIKRLPRTRTRTTTHNQRRRAAQRRKQHGS